MSSVSSALQRFRDQPAPPEGVSGNPFKLSSTLHEPATASEVEEAWPSRRLPAQLVEAWSSTREANLFEDVDYGQWGLVLLSPTASAERTSKELQARPATYRTDDLVIGEFLGDQELLVLAGSEGGGGQVLVALPLDDRADWYVVAEDLAEFLASYFRHAGEKFWESPAT